MGAKERERVGERVRKCVTALCPLVHIFYALPKLAITFLIPKLNCVTSCCYRVYIDFAQKWAWHDCTLLTGSRKEAELSCKFVIVSVF